MACCLIRFKSSPAAGGAGGGGAAGGVAAGAAGGASGAGAGAPGAWLCGTSKAGGPGAAPGLPLIGLFALSGLKFQPTFYKLMVSHNPGFVNCQNANIETFKYLNV